MDGAATTPAVEADDGSCVSVFVLGASGDLAHKKTYPSLYELYLADLLPKRICIVGYARSSIPDDDFRATIRKYLKVGTPEQVEAFLQLCIYRAGKYDDAEAMKKVSAETTSIEDRLTTTGVANRLFYFAIPPSVFVASARTVKEGGLTTRGWNRVVVEKPFGRDSATSAELGAQLAKCFPEEWIYRIDHYLGKEMVQNLMALRFGNAVFEPLWNRFHIKTVQITFKEPFGTEGRGGYFDEFGIIRDVMQNHLLQVMSLVAMETPVSLAAEDVRDEKVKVLKVVQPLELCDVVLGQYGPNAAGTKPSYLQDDTVPRGSVTPTFATAVLHVNNSRWKGVPFILKCGKALNERKAEIRIQFQEPANGLFEANPVTASLMHNNELVIRIQPEEAVYLKLMSKMPGLTFAPVETELSLSYKSRYPTRPPPEAYARLLLDVLRGDQSQFVRADELAAAWAIFTPLLHRIESERIAPTIYPYGSRGPPASDKLIASVGYNFEGRYAGEWRRAHDAGAAKAALQAVRDEFTLSKDRLAHIMNNFLGEMSRGLSGEPSSIKMIPSYVTALPTGQEQGSVWAIDMGGSNLRVLEVVLQGGGAIRNGREHKEAIPQATMRAPAAVLFDFIAKACQTAGMPDGATVGFTFSFPVDQTGIDAGTLIEWTKGFSNPGVVGHDVVELLSAGFKRAGYTTVKVAALVNDTVGTLMARAYIDTKARMGVILGTGTNAAYIERAAKIDKWHGGKDGFMVINMEWGGFGSGSAFDLLPSHAVDHHMDAHTPNEGKQRYEKMIAGMYLGELTRLLVVHLMNSGVVFVREGSGSPHKGIMHTPWAFPTAYMSDIATDESADLSAVARVLKDKCGLDSSLEDRRVMVEVCELVARRAARLSAVGIAAVVTQMGDEGCESSAGIDGSVFKKYPKFQQWMEEALTELGVCCSLQYAEDGSGMGAALTAVVAANGGAAKAVVTPHSGGAGAAS